MSRKVKRKEYVSVEFDREAAHTALACCAHSRKVLAGLLCDPEHRGDKVLQKLIRKEEDRARRAVAALEFALGLVGE